MNRTLSTAASGMEAQDTKMSVIANNLANTNTTGFKKSRVNFHDVLYDNLRPATTQGLDGNAVPSGTQIGQGVRTAGTLRQFTMGDLKETGRAYDVAIKGPGFFQVQQTNGEMFYTRDGGFEIDQSGRLVTRMGAPIEPSITIPTGVTTLTIAPDGLVSANFSDRNQATELGRLTVANFINPSGLEPRGDNVYAATIASGSPMVEAPGTNGTGQLGQQMLEMSNVRAVDEMIELIVTQRAYEMGTKVLQAGDQMLGATANIR